MYVRLQIALFALLMSACIRSSMAWSFAHLKRRTGSVRSGSLRAWGFMDAINKAMANENMGPPPNAGLSKEPEKINVSFIGSKKANVKAIAGQKVSMVANAARVPIKYNCKAGDCGTCEVNLDGRIVKACQAVLPNKPNIKIQPLK